jgi:putative component of membrane protein insertase Oxa1/YidC/SpoIIIJ protein YidD
MATDRILRCNPWGTSGYDPVPRVLIKKADLSKYGRDPKEKMQMSSLMEDKPPDD